MDAIEIFTKNLAQAIKDSGQKKKDIANKIGISNSTLSQYLSGRSQPSLFTFKRLCEVLECSSDDILGLK